MLMLNGREINRNSISGSLGDFDSEGPYGKQRNGRLRELQEGGGFRIPLAAGRESRK